MNSSANIAFPFEEADLPISHDHSYVWCYVFMGIIVVLGINVVALFEIEKANRDNT